MSINAQAASPLERLSLAGRRALVTGGARGIGRATAVDLAALGAEVVVLDLDAEGVEAVAHEIDGVAIAADVSDREQMRAAVQTAREVIGGVDILVNNAGVASTRDLLEVDYEHWLRVQQINVDSMLHLCQLTLPEMVERRSGRIVNLSSIAGKRGGGYVGRIAYATSKAAVLGFTKALAREFGPSGITVNAVAPGGMETEMTKSLLTDPDVIAKVLASIPLGYRGTAQDVAGAIAFLVSDLGAYVNGETIIVDGGVMTE